MDITSLLHTQVINNKKSVHDKDDDIKSVNKIDLSDEHKKVAEEMESLFAYQLIKTMRETANALSDEKKSSGHNTYMSMFDIEISKLFAKRGMGLQDSILNWLERMPASAAKSVHSQEND